MKRFPPFIENLPELDLPYAGATGHLLQGEAIQAVFLHFTQDVEVPAHSHSAQWEIVIAGELQLELDGDKRTYRVGESIYIPEGAVHAAWVRAGYHALVIFDQPDRYRVK
jgi:quercetin dioxygenase-like cupin family protein